MWEKRNSDKFVLLNGKFYGWNKKVNIFGFSVFTSFITGQITPISYLIHSSVAINKDVPWTLVKMYSSKIIHSHLKLVIIRCGSAVFRWFYTPTTFHLPQIHYTHELLLFKFLYSRCLYVVGMVRYD